MEVPLPICGLPHHALERRGGHVLVLVGKGEEIGLMAVVSGLIDAVRPCMVDHSLVLLLRRSALGKHRVSLSAVESSGWIRAHRSLIGFFWVDAIADSGHLRPTGPPGGNPHFAPPRPGKGRGNTKDHLREGSLKGGPGGRPAPARALKARRGEGARLYAGLGGLRRRLLALEVRRMRLVSAQARKPIGIDGLCLQIDVDGVHVKPGAIEG